MFHVCTSNGLGYCAECRREGASLASPVASLVSALRAVRAFLKARASASRAAHGLAADAAGMGLDSVAKATTALVGALAGAESPGTLRDLVSRLETYKGEVVRASEGSRRRAAKAAAKAAKAQAVKVAAQAERIALRASMDATYRVWIKFARGAHSVVVSREAPKGHREARASVKVRGDAPGLRYGAAERIRDGIKGKLAAPRRHA